LSQSKAFQAYSTCKLYKKTKGVGYASLVDGGKTLKIGWYSRTGTGIDLTADDLSCAMRVMKVPSTVIRRIEATRPIDGYIEIKYKGGFVGYFIRPGVGIGGSMLDANFTG
jgi:hypothetical protein